MNKVEAEIGSNVRTIVWDLDGTVLDSFGIYQECLNRAFQGAGLSEIPEQILRHNHHGTMVESITGILEDMNVSATVEEMEALVQAFFVLDNAYIEDVDHHLFKDAVDLAQRAHKADIRQIIVTNRSHGTNRDNASPRNMVQNSCLRDMVSQDDILCGDDSGCRKPARGVLEARFGNNLAALGEIVIIGDQFVDAEFARNIGCKAILITRADTIAHLDRLAGWKEYVRLVPSLLNVTIATS